MKIRVYTTEVCPSCKQLKQTLEQHDKTYQEVNIATPEALTELALSGVFTLSAPVLQVGDRFYTYDQLFKDNTLNLELLNNILSEEEGA
jgi:glutaredoxin